MKQPHTGMSQVRPAGLVLMHRGSDPPGKKHVIYYVHHLDEHAEPAILILETSRDGIEYFSSVFKSDIPGKEPLPIC